MIKKYELLKKESNNLRRIKALKSFGNVCEHCNKEYVINMFFEGRKK